MNIDLLHRKISNSDYLHLITVNSENFSTAEHELLDEILNSFEFDTIQEQALAQAVMQQAKFDPSALHIEDDDEDTTGVCPHCINPPMPPLRDYLVWRQTSNRT